MIENYLNNRFLTLYFLPFIIGSLSVFSFQPFNLTFINFVILPVFFYLIVYIKKRSKSRYRKKPFKKNLFIFGTSFGFGFYLCGIHWINNSLTFDESFKILIPFGLILIPIFLSLFFSLLTSFIGPFLDFNFKSIVLLSGGMAFSDYIRSKIFTGFPWNLWAYSFSEATEIIQILNIIGLFAFNLITITIFLLPTVLFFKVNLINKIFTISIIVLLLTSFFIYGNHSINRNENLLSINETKFNVKVISPNFTLNYGLSEGEIKKRLEKLIRYSEPDKELKTLFVWPEGVFSGYSFKEILYLKKIFLNNFSDNHFILFGINRHNDKVGGLFNSLIVINNQMEIVEEYKKQKLVPFGEFLPFEKTLNKIGLKKITEGYGSFLKGERQQGNIIIDNLNILPLICYEVIFTELAQNSNSDTNLIVNISEDGWFGDSIGPHQHFAKAIFRAIEQNLFLVRSVNKGTTAIISNKGQILKILNSNESGSIEQNVPLIQSKRKNKNDLIFYILLITYIFIFKFYKKKHV